MRNARVLSVALAVILLCGTGQVWAQRPLLGSFSISPFGGAVIPIGDFADTDLSNENAQGATAGFCAGGAIEYGLTENLAVGGRFTYNQFGVDDAFAEAFAQGGTFDGNYKITEIFGAYLKLLMGAGSATRPFVRAGVFAAKPKLSGDLTDAVVTGEVEAEIDNSLGIDAGVGVLHMFSPQVGGFIEGSGAYLLTDGKEIAVTLDGEEFGTPVEFTTNLQWITVRAGVSIFFGGSGQ